MSRYRDFNSMLHRERREAANDPPAVKPVTLPTDATQMKHLAPDLHLHVTPETCSRICLCGATWQQHFDGWDGNRLSRSEACRRVGLAPAVERDRCIYCNTELSGNCEIRDEHYPYCSAHCAIDAENDR